MIIDIFVRFYFHPLIMNNCSKEIRNHRASLFQCFVVDAVNYERFYEGAKTITSTGTRTTCDRAKKNSWT